MGTGPDRLLQHLTLLYGPEAAAGVTARAADLLHRRAPDLAPPPAAGPWSPADALLIAYPDQVRTPGAPPLASLLDFCRRRLSGMVTGVHLLPFYPSSSDEGFSVVDYRAVDPGFGTWDHVQALGRDFRLMVDLVLNHASARGAWFQGFLRDQAPYDAYFISPDASADWSRVVRPRASPLFHRVRTASGEREVWTTFGPDQVDLNYRNPALLLEMLDILLDYVAAGAQLIRLDAVTYVWKEPGSRCVHRPEGHALVRLFRSALDQVAPWVRLVTETNVPHAENVAYFGDGDEADMVYQFALPPLVIHTLASGSAEALTAWCGSLRSPPGDGTYLNFLASHDGIGLTPAAGLLPEADVARLIAIAEARGAVSVRSTSDGKTEPYELNLNLLDALSRPGSPESDVPRLLAAHAILLSLPGVPALYLHSLVGSRGDPAAVRATGRARSINRHRFEGDRLETELDRPGSERQRTMGGMQRLLGARASLAALHPLAGSQTVDLGPHLFTLRRDPEGQAPPVLCLQEIRGESAQVTLPSPFRAGLDRLRGAWVEDEILLAPYQSAWIEASR